VITEGSGKLAALLGQQKRQGQLTLPLVFYREGSLAYWASKALRLYEQEPPHLRVRRLGEYLRRWRRWAVGDDLSEAVVSAGGGAIISASAF